MYLLPLILLIVTLPLGVAVQNITASLVVILMVFNIIKSGSIKNDLQKIFALKFHFLIPVILAIAFLLWLSLATVLNKNHPTGLFGKFLGGYSYWALLPLVLLANYQKLASQHWQSLYKIGAIVCLLWGLVTLSQFIWGWRVVGTSFVEGPTRAQGFYSHPLTLAYSALLIFPFAAFRLTSDHRNKFSWALFVGASLLVLTSQSRSVQIVCAVVLAFNILKYAKGNLKLGLVVVSLIGVVLLGTTDNRLKKRFVSIFDSNYIKSSSYVDDRLIFWEVHSNMFKDRPILGHGTDLTTSYRVPWYEAAGFAGIDKKYEAHNVFLQVAVCGGVIGLILFLSWWCYYYYVFWRLIDDPYAVMLLVTMTAFCIASITQNSFQDSEVRNTLTLFTGFAWLFLYQSDQRTLERLV